MVATAVPPAYGDRVAPAATAASALAVPMVSTHADSRWDPRRAPASRAPTIQPEWAVPAALATTESAPPLSAKLAAPAAAVGWVRASAASAEKGALEESAHPAARVVPGVTAFPAPTVAGAAWAAQAAMAPLGEPAATGVLVATSATAATAVQGAPEALAPKVAEEGPAEAPVVAAHPLLVQGVTAEPAASVLVVATAAMVVREAPAVTVDCYSATAARGEAAATPLTEVSVP